MMHEKITTLKFLMRWTLNRQASWAQWLLQLLPTFFSYFMSQKHEFKIIPAKTELDNFGRTKLLVVVHLANLMPAGCVNRVAAAHNDKYIRPE